MSNRQVVIAKGLVAVRTGDCAASPAPPSTGLLRGVDLKELQQKAFDRGREVERAEAAKRVIEASQALQSAAEKIQQARSTDREEIEDFSVRLACVIAESFIGVAIEKSQHDVRGLAKKVLDQVMPDFVGGELLLEGHPEDIPLLPEEVLAARGGPSLRIASDPALERGSFRVRCEGAEFYSSVHERLRVAEAQLREELARARHA